MTLRSFYSSSAVYEEKNQINNSKTKRRIKFE